MYGVGLILGAGIYVLIGDAAGFAGNSMWISFLLGTIVAVFAGLSYAELTAMFPKAAAEYTFVKNAFKSNFFGYIIGWLTAVTSIIFVAAVALGFAGYFVRFVELPITVIAILLIGVLSVINFIGIREATWANTIFAIVTVVGLILIIIVGFTTEPAHSIDYFEMPLGGTGLALAFVLVFFAFIGFQDLANIAEEVKNPHKTLPRAIIISIIVTAIIYLLVALAVIRVISWEELSISSAPLADVAKVVLGTNGSISLSIFALFATVGTVLISLVAGARMIYGMAKSNSLPNILGKIHYKTKTPWVAVIVMMVTSMVFSLSEDIVLVANMGVFAVVVTFAAINLAVIILRYTEPQLDRPFRIPINIGKFPILPAFGFITSVYMAFQFDIQIVLFGLVMVVIGTVFYFILKKKNKISNSDV
jgi:APA family basic amino acid/polyamine antiporter